VAIKSPNEVQIAITSLLGFGPPDGIKSMKSGTLKGQSMRLQTLAVSLSLPLGILLTGCSLNPTAPAVSVNGAAIRGNLHGGRQPIAGAHVYLFAAGNTGYGQPSLSLLNSGSTGNSDAIGAYVLTDSSGGFTITGAYSCTVGTQVYLYALGGDPGNGINSAAGLLAVLGNCPAEGNFLTTTPFIAVDEVSTVAAAYAMAGYATDATHVSSSGTPLAATGIANAFATASNLADLGTGTALSITPAGNGTVPQAEINTLANILSTCVNSTGPSDPACSTLFSNTMSNGTNGTIPTDTATAAINLAHNPAAGTTALFGLQPGIGAPFVPTLSAVPNDFTVALTFTNSGLSSSRSLAIDGQGNVWATDAGDDVVKLNSLGVPLSPALGYTNSSLHGPAGIAIDGSGNAWITNSGFVSTSLVRLSSSGTFMTSASTGTSDAFYSLSMDPFGNVWLPAPTSKYLYKFDGSGNYLGSFPTSYNIDGIAIDHSGNIWTSDDSQNSLSEFNNSGTVVAGSPFAAGVSNPGPVAFNANGNVWTLNGSGNFGILTSSGGPVSGAPYNTSSSGSASNFALDGLGNAWVVTKTSAAGNSPNPFSFQIAGISNSGNNISGPSGYALDNTVQQVNAIALDGSGNIWLDTSDSLIEFVGVGAPVVTPVVTAAVNNTFATRP
jgi:streptogramin lyase